MAMVLVIDINDREEAALASEHAAFVAQSGSTELLGVFTLRLIQHQVIRPIVERVQLGQHQRRVERMGLLSSQDQAAVDAILNK